MHDVTCVLNQITNSDLSDLLQPELPLSVFKRGRVTLLVQIHPHELVNGQLAGGRVLKLVQPVNHGTNAVSDVGSGNCTRRVVYCTT